MLKCKSKRRGKKDKSTACTAESNETPENGINSEHAEDVPAENQTSVDREEMSEKQGGCVLWMLMLENVL